MQKSIVGQKQTLCRVKHRTYYQLLIIQHHSDGWYPLSLYFEPKIHCNPVFSMSKFFVSKFFYNGSICLGTKTKTTRDECMSTAWRKYGRYNSITISAKLNIHRNENAQVTNRIAVGNFQISNFVAASHVSLVKCLVIGFIYNLKERICMRPHMLAKIGKLSAICIDLISKFFFDFKFLQSFCGLRRENVRLGISIFFLSNTNKNYLKKFCSCVEKILNFFLQKKKLQI